MATATATATDVLKGRDRADRKGNIEALVDAGFDRQAAFMAAGQYANASDRRTLLSQRVPLGSLLRDGVPAETFLPSPTLGERLFYDESVWIISGHKKSGKSWAVAATAVDAVNAGRPVVYIDFENRSKRFARRLIALGADPDAIDEFMHYIELPTGLSLDTLGQDIAEIAKELPGAFIVVDSLRGLMARLSPAGRPLDPNAAQDVESVCAPLNVAAAAGLTVGIIDHAKKGGSDSDEYSTSGSQAKEAAVDAVYFFTKAEAYNKTTRGLVKLKATSDRDGELDFERHFRVGGQGEELFTFERVDSQSVGVSGRIQEDVLDFLANASGPVSRAQVDKGVKGNRSEVLKGLDLVAAREDYVHVLQNPRRAGSYLYEYDESCEPPAGGLPL